MSRHPRFAGRGSRPARRTTAAAGLGLLVWLAAHSPSTDAAAGPNQLTAGRLTVRADFSLDGYAARVREIADLDRELHRTLGIPGSRQPIDIQVFGSKQAYAEHLRRHLPKVPYRRALYVQQADRGSVLVYRHPDLATDLRHECTHAILHTSLPSVPLWLDEGLAEYFELPADQRAFDNPHLTWLFKTELHLCRYPA